METFNGFVQSIFLCFSGYVVVNAAINLRKWLDARNDTRFDWEA